MIESEMRCPRCGSTARQHQSWKPEVEPKRYHRRCYDCGWRRTWRITPEQMRLPNGEVGS